MFATKLLRERDFRTWLLCKCTRAQLAAWNTGYTYVNAVYAHIYGQVCGVTANCACEYAAVYIHSKRRYARTRVNRAYTQETRGHAMYHRLRKPLFKETVVINESRERSCRLKNMGTWISKVRIPKERNALDMRALVAAVEWKTW